MEPNGYREAADYLMAAGRYDEAVDWYERLDSTYLATDGAKMTFDIIATRLSPCYMAYRKAVRSKTMRPSWQSCTRLMKKSWH